MNGREERTVRNDVRDTILVSSVRLVFIEQDSSRSVCDKTPVLHGTHGLIWRCQLASTAKESRAPYKFMDSEQISLGQRVFDFEHF